MGVMIIAKNQNTFAKRAREMEKKRKAEEKLSRRKERQAAEPVLPQDLPDADTLALPSTENLPVDDN